MLAAAGILVEGAYWQGRGVESLRLSELCLSARPPAHTYPRHPLCGQSQLEPDVLWHPQVPVFFDPLFLFVAAHHASLGPPTIVQGGYRTIGGPQ